MSRVRNRTPLFVVGSAVIIIACVAGCGGGAEETSTTATTSVLPPSTTTTVQPDGTTDPTIPLGTTTSIDATTTTVAESPLAEDGYPRDFGQARREGRPMLILFYVPGQVDDEKVATTVRELRSTYPTYAFLIYDYRYPEQYGELYTFLDGLGMGYQPYIALFDRHGTHRRTWSGYVDKGTLNQTLIDLGRY